jgi:hypothetical protein
MHVRAPLRFLRACLITISTLSLAAAAHTGAGGHLPGISVLVLLAVLSLAPVMLLCRYRLGLPVMAGVLATSQTALHWAFTTLAETAEHCTGPGIPAHGHHQPVTFTDCATTSGIVAGHELTGGSGAAMFAAHVLATAATAVLLARGEVALWQVLAWLKPLAAILAPAPLPARARILTRHPETVVVPHPALLVPALRGPPKPMFP